MLDRRVAAARSRLETTADRLADIAYACGFSSQTHVTATFSKRLGITPGAYRESIRTVVSSA